MRFLKVICLTVFFITAKGFSSFSQKVVSLTFLKDDSFREKELNLSKGAMKKNAPYEIEDVEVISLVPNNTARKDLSTNSPIYTIIRELGDVAFLSEPGDSVMFTLFRDRILFSGTGASKYQLIYAGYKEMSRTLKFLNRSELLNDSEKYALIDSTELVIHNLLDKSKNDLTLFAYKFIATDLIAPLETERIRIFFNQINAKDKLLSSADMLALYIANIKDKFDLKYFNDLGLVPGNLGIYLHSKTLADFYKFNQFNNYVGQQDPQLKAKMFQIFNFARDNYDGLLKEQIETQIIIFWIIRNAGFSKETESLLKEYYTSSGYPAFKSQVKKYELDSRKLEKGMLAPEFTLTDSKGKAVRLEDFRGKVVLMDFWFTGCVGCLQMNPVLKKVEGIYKTNPNVVFISISVDKDKDKWLRSISLGNYTTLRSVNLYTSGLGVEHDLITKYNVTGYPQLFLIDQYGQFLDLPVPNPKNDNGDLLIQMINSQLSKSGDVAHLLYDNNKAFLSEIKPQAEGSLNRLNSRPYVKESNAPIVISNASHLDFSVVLKPEVENEPDTYTTSDKILVLSDIEGSFLALRDLLVRNKVIDDNFNWTFGSGHLVLNGDMVDRGDQVFEVLWLIYSLEDKAKRFGGYVHYILGNHEIMNMSGKLKYLHKKYLYNENEYGLKYMDLIGKNSELGRWLRTKNVIEIIKGNMFVHAGISKELCQSVMKTPEINQLTRQFYGSSDSSITAKKNEKLQLLFDTKKSPFWYRDYYQSDADPQKARESLVDSVLGKFNIKRIITGHTIIADTISTLYSNKVLNTDVPHAKGKSEALLIEGNTFYRVNDKGQRFFLFKDEE